MVTVAAGTDTLSKIRGGPHWEVVIHPSRFEAKRVSTLRDCREAVEQAQVALLPGRQYPRIENEADYGNDWVGSGATRDYYLHEYWRMYQSGQFVHWFTFLDDVDGLDSLHEWDERAPSFKPDGFTPNGYLNVDGAFYTFTEVFEFAARLIAAKVLDEAPAVRISMSGVKNRVLSAGTRRMPAPRPHYATADTLEHEWQLSGPGIYGEAARLAREAARWFFERFGCHDFPEESLKREQDEFLAKRGLRV